MRPLDRLRWLQGCVPFIKMSTFSRPRSLPRPAHEAVALKNYKDKIFGPFPVEEVIDQDYAISVALPPHLDLVWPVMHPWHLRPAKHPKFRNRPIKFLEPDPAFPVEELRTSGYPNPRSTPNAPSPPIGNDPKLLAQKMTAIRAQLSHSQSMVTTSADLV